MTTINFKISGNFKTGNFLHDHFKEGGPSPSTEIITQKQDCEKIFKMFDKNDLSIIIMASNSKGASINIPLSFKNATSINNIRITTRSDKPGIALDLNANFTAEIDNDDAKEIKKYYKSGNLNFYLTTIKLHKETESPYSYSTAMGILDGGDWETDESWHKIGKFDSDLFGSIKPSKQKTKSELIAKLSSNVKIVIPELNGKTFNEFFGEDPSIRVSITIPNASNSILIKLSELNSKFSIKKDTLIINFNSNYSFKIDSWLKKYKSHSPFPIELKCIFDSNSNIHYFGEMGNSGFNNSPKIGELVYSDI
jgi:hypothetical protein